MREVQGFTLIELMIVVAIIGVLAAISLPIYQDYIARSQVSEAVLGTSQVRIAITDYYGSLGRFPPGPMFSVANNAGRYTKSLEVTDATGVVTATMGDATYPISQRIRGMQFTLSPGCVDTDGGRVIAAWHCDSAPQSLKYLPSGCQERPAGVADC